MVCRYGDIHPATDVAKIFFMLYVLLSAIVQLTVLASFVHNSVKFRVAKGIMSETADVRIRPVSCV